MSKIRVRTVDEIISSIKPFNIKDVIRIMHPNASEVEINEALLESRKVARELLQRIDLTGVSPTD